MQKLQKSLLTLSMLLILGSCFTSLEMVNFTGDKVLDQGVRDSLYQIGGSISGLTQWMNISENEQNSLSSKSLINYFIGGNKFIYVSVKSQNGMGFYNELVCQLAREGGFSSSSSGFTISSPLMDNITDVFAKQGYTKIYEFTPIKGKAWYSPKIGGSGTWEDT
ncbi:MAG: hypothetical protein ACRC0X_08620, partial [Brevinema sp.]